MDEKPIDDQSRLLIQLGEPETWLETMLREARRQALHAAAKGDEPLAKRWRKLAKGLDQATAASADNPMVTGEPNDSATQSQGETAH
jgi:hypothetical protein